MCIPVISYLPGFISLFQLVMRIVLYNFGSFLYLVGHIFYHCGIHKSDKQDLYSVMPTLIKNANKHRPKAETCGPSLPPALHTYHYELFQTTVDPY